MSNNQLSNTGEFARFELELFMKTARKEDQEVLAPFIENIIALCDQFGKSGQSGGSAPYSASALTATIKSLLLMDPIMPVSNNSNEWFEYEEGKFQSKRCSALFKEGKTPAYYLDAIVWKDQNGITTTGRAKTNNGEEYNSWQYVRFPFTPKSFYIDVERVHVANNDYENIIKNEKQLHKVWSYYQHPVIGKYQS